PTASGYYTTATVTSTSIVYGSDNVAPSFDGYSTAAYSSKTDDYSSAAPTAAPVYAAPTSSSAAYKDPSSCGNSVGSSCGSSAASQSDFEIHLTATLHISAVQAACEASSEEDNYYTSAATCAPSPAPSSASSCAPSSAAPSKYGDAAPTNAGYAPQNYAVTAIAYDKNAGLFDEDAVFNDRFVAKAKGNKKVERIIYKSIGRL
ncbi:hypothetical protein J3B02_006068, partial [Coemansia erecta]